MGKFRLFLQCFFSPRLLKVYPDTHIEGFYDAGSFEKIGDQIISSIHLLFNLGLYMSPFIATVLYKKGFFVMDGMVTMSKFAAGVSLIIVTSYIIRGIGRMNDPTYVTFLKTLKAAQTNLNQDTKRELMKYDFDFIHWPVSFSWNDVEGEEKKNRSYIKRPSTRSSAIDRVCALPCDIVSYLVAHTFGLRMVYPGSIYLLQYLMSPLLLAGRVKLINENKGERFKVQTRDGNQIDTMFVDRRGDKNFSKGDVLVICSEGNAGYYEIGIMVTPIEAGYSVLGWNRPGFGGSTGMPYPSQEINAIDTVVQFAIHSLNFKPESIVLFGWSIGGYPAAWAAMNYPEIKGVVLDATFDDIVALAVMKMPGYLAPIVKRTIRDHINLNVYEHIAKYPGPVLFVRRTEDEVLCTDDYNKLSTNRGNNLLVKFLRYRYPNIIDDAGYIVLNEWLAVTGNRRNIMKSKYHLDEDICTGTITSYITEHSNSFPMLIGEGFDEQFRSQLAIFLAMKHMADFPSTHCSPLPISLFKMPWDGVGENGFVTL